MASFVSRHAAHVLTGHEAIEALRVPLNIWLSAVTVLQIIWKGLLRRHILSVQGPFHEAVSSLCWGLGLVRWAL